MFPYFFTQRKKRFIDLFHNPAEDAIEAFTALLKEDSQRAEPQLYNWVQGVLHHTLQDDVHQENPILEEYKKFLQGKSCLAQCAILHSYMLLMDKWHNDIASIPAALEHCKEMAVAAGKYRIVDVMKAEKALEKVAKEACQSRFSEIATANAEFYKADRSALKLQVPPNIYVNLYPYVRRQLRKYGVEEKPTLSSEKLTPVASSSTLKDRVDNALSTMLAAFCMPRTRNNRFLKVTERTPINDDGITRYDTELKSSQRKSI